MGASKSALDFGGRPILERIAAELFRAFDDIVIVEGASAESSVAFKLPVVKRIRDEVAFAGPLDAMRRGLEAAARDVAFVCSCDLPLLRHEVAAMLCARVADSDAAIPEIDGMLQPLCAAYRKSVAHVIASMSARGEKRVLKLADEIRVVRINEAELRLSDPELRSFINVNTPEDYQRALRIGGDTR
jgi:molybdopterin-guanine dinucleotide biosynthesis protein A